MVLGLFAAGCIGESFAQGPPPRRGRTSARDAGRDAASADASSADAATGEAGSAQQPRQYDFLDEQIDIFRTPATTTRVPVRAAVARVVRLHEDDVRGCYRDGIAQHTGVLRGNVEVSFVLASDGRVTSSEAGRTELPVTSVGECLARVVRAWRFMPLEGGGEVRVRWTFNLERWL